MRGGVIGGVITTVWTLLSYGCAVTTGSGGFACLPLIFFGPLGPLASIWDNNPIFNSLSIIWLPVFSIVIWFAVGSLIGSIVGHFKSKKKSPPV